ncbi:GGDEF domain-containing protein [Salinibius halmophilus]|uniref:GGDEF domain-containing protein n=1 Tax=Salinibius halmophilus TaxID=1853216 RepID=UPI001313F9CA|nr:diguanylate cyclase [Salinibius halmophilus]
MATLCQTAESALLELSAALRAKRCLLILQDHESRLSAWVNNDQAGHFDPSVEIHDLPTQAKKLIAGWDNEVCLRRIEPEQIEQPQGVCLALPLIDQYRHLGSIYVFVEKPISKQLLQRAFAYCRELAPQISHYIPSRTRHVRLSQDASDYSQAILIALHNITVGLATQHFEEDAIKMAVQRGRKALYLDRLAVFLIDGENVRGTWGTTPEGELSDESDYRCRWPKHPLVNEAIKRKDHVVVRDNAVLTHDGEALGIGWNAMVALWHKNHAIGWLAVDNLIEQKPLLAIQKEAVKLLGTALSQNIIRIRQERQLVNINRDLEEKINQRTAQLQAANKKLAQLSRVDGLTQLYNRRYLDEKLAQEWARLARQHRELSVIMVDVDYFKQYNDHFGHIAGDQCLQQVAKVLRIHSKRAADCSARYGGEEFALVLPETNIACARFIAESIRIQVAALAIDHVTEQGMVTVSVGVACTTPDQLGLVSNLVKAADQALYQAKANGRNQVCAQPSKLLSKPPQETA